MELSLLEFPKKLAQAYTQLCRPLCRELGLSQTALDILLFLANNPRYQTAGDIVEVRHIPASLVSVNVERLVQDGLLRREPVPGDRRRIRLCCTDTAQPIIQRGREVQARFFRALWADTSPELRAAFEQAMEQMDKNLDGLLKEEVK